MSDQQTAVGTADGPYSQDLDLTWNERVKIEKLAIFARRDMVTDAGSIDQFKVADEIEPTILAAIASIEADRTKVGITPTQFMERHFPEVLRKEQAETEDEEELDFIDAVYGVAKSEVFRVLNVSPDGPIQSRLAVNGSGLVLCRMREAGRRGGVATSTRNRKCIDEEEDQPASRRSTEAIAKASALTGMSIERVPEHRKLVQAPVLHRDEAEPRQRRQPCPAGAGDVDRRRRRQTPTSMK